MSLWCQGFPTVTVPAGPPKRVTLVVPYYENRAFFGAQLRRWASYPAPLLEWLSVIVVDDGSPTHSAASVVSEVGAMPTPLRVFRIEVDVRWNWLAARNIGFHYAQDGWVLVTDMDHVVPTETMDAVIHGQHDPSVVYAFSRKEHTGETVNPHSASFLMTRKMFWTIGGYDEALSGHYGTDGTFRREVAKRAKIHILTDSLIRYEYVEDSSTSTYKRKQPEDAAVRRLVAARKPNWTPKVLSFPYHEEPVGGRCGVR